MKVLDIFWVSFQNWIFPRLDFPGDSSGFNNSPGNIWRVLRWVVPIGGLELGDLSEEFQDIFIECMGEVRTKPFGILV